MLLKYHTNLNVKVLAIFFSNMQTVLSTLTSHLFHCVTSRMLRHLAHPCLTLSAPHVIYKKSLNKNRFRFEQVKYNTIYAFGANNESGIRSRQVGLNIFI